MEKLPKFDIRRDIKIIEDGGFFCQACVVAKDKAAISSDPRYCQDCFDVLREERALGEINKRRKKQWVRK